MKKSKNSTLKSLAEELIKTGSLAELQKEIENLSNNNWQCHDCKYKFQSLKKKRVCPKCKSKNIKKFSTEYQTTTKPISVPTKSKETTKGKQCKTTSLNIQTNPIDPGGYKDITTPTTDLTPRRPAYRPHKVVCSECNKQEYVNSIHAPSKESRDNYLCDSCIDQKIKNQYRT